ncbi:MAG: hypothetical protein IKE70_00360 [Bacilli bacterium]|nr:hypothetical protein [Bacilli bacterium]
MIGQNIEGLYEKLKEANRCMKSLTNIEDKMALSNYIGNLYTVIGNVLNQKIKPKKKQIFGDKKGYKKFYELYDLKEDEMLENFIRYKEYHSNLLEEIIPNVEDIMLKFCDEEIIDEESIPKDEFYSIFMEFMKTLKLDELFLKYLKEGRIHSTVLKDGDTCLASTIYNPFSKEIDISVSNFQYTTLSMFSLAHEFGHVYDLSNLDVDHKTYNQYFYQSFYGEVYSKLFERLFITYMIKNHIYEDQCRDKIFQMELINHDYLLSSYILSLLPDGYIEDSCYRELSKFELIDEVKNHFYHEDGVMSYLLGIKDLDVRDDFTYAYGDIISMFLKEEVENSGLDNELMDEFKKIRTNLFSSDFLEKHDMNSSRYVKLYKKEVGLLKK